MYYVQRIDYNMNILLWEISNIKVDRIHFMGDNESPIPQLLSTNSQS